MTDVSYSDQVCTWAGEATGSVLEYPFGPEAAVFKVGGKIFALVAVDGAQYVTLKVEPDDGVALRAQYAFVREGYYMNKRHWITIDLGPEVPMAEVRELIEDSHKLVTSTLTRKLRTELGLFAT